MLYCDANGDEATTYPELPNGSLHGLAGVSGSDGLAMAFMPHPERSAWLWQVPEDLPGSWGERRRAAARNWDLLNGDGPGMLMLRAFGRLNEGA